MRHHALAVRSPRRAGLALTGALLCLLPAGAEAASPAKAEVRAAFKELAQETRGLSSRGATGDARKQLLKIATRARRASSKKPCRSVALLENYRDQLADGRGGGLRRSRGELAADALAADAALKALGKTRRCGGGGGLAGTDFRTEVLASDNQGMTLHVSLPIARFTAEKGGGQNFSQLHMGDLGPVGDPGEPGVPSLTEQFALPIGADVSVKVTDVSSYTLDGVNLFPEQEEAVDAPNPNEPGPAPGQPPQSDFFDPPFTIDRQAYKSKTPFPAEEATGSALGSMRDLRLGGVKIAGAQYTPKSDKLEVFTGIDVEIAFGGPNSGVFTDARALDPFNVAFQRIYKSTLMNYDVARQNVSNSPHPPLCGEELLIITSPTLRPAADALAASRGAAGYFTVVREVGSPAVGSTNTEIQSFIRGELSADCWVRPAYVILLGDVDQVPTFLVPCNAPGTEPPENPCDVASDLPFALQDDTDFFADTALGRIPASDLATANTVVNKIIGYETSSPAPAADSFFNHTTVTAYFQQKLKCVLNEGQSGEPNCKSANGPITGHYENDLTVKKDTRGFTKVAEEVRAGMLDEGMFVDRIYTAIDEADPEEYHDGTPIPPELQKPTFPWNGNGADLLEDFNEGRNIVFHRDHGWAQGWADPTFHNGDVPAMTNGTQLPVAFGINCSSAQFDHPSPSLMEAMLQHPGGGTVGAFGDTRVSGTWANNSIARGFFDALFPAVKPSYGSPDPLERMGDVLLAGKQYLAVESAGATYKHSHLYGYFGDPTMQLWIDRPVPIDPSQFESVLHRSEPLPGPRPPGPGPDPPPFWVSVNVANPALEGTIATLQRNGAPIGRALIQNGQAIISPLTNTSPTNLSVGLEQDGFIAAQDSVASQ